MSSLCTLVNSVRFTGWLGITLSLLAIGTGNLTLFLVAQVVAALCAFLWCLYLQSKISADIVVSLLLTIAAAVFRNQWLLYIAMLTRAVSYQFVFEKVLRERRDKCKS